MKHRILRTASREFEEAVAYYNRQVHGLGYESAAEFTEAGERIREYPNAWLIFEGTVRRYRLARFPYGILYHIHEQTLLVVGLMHLAMDPIPWRERMQGTDPTAN